MPPPKPKNYKSGGGMGDGGWDPYGEARKGGGYGGPPFYGSTNGGLSDDYSGLDSGQGSSLDRKYDTFGRSTGKVRLGYRV